MQLSSHPEVLALDWVPPVILGREKETAEAVRRLDPPEPCHPPPWIVAIAGPSGAGSSALARRVAREVADRVRAAGTAASPRVLAVRTAPLKGTHGIATALLERLDEGFDGRGFPVNEILAGFLRRLRREGRPTVVVLDDLRVGGPDPAPVLRALAEPDRFLPEGEVGLPPTWVIVAGTPEGVGSAERALKGRPSLRPFLGLAPYDERTLTVIVRDRIARAVGPVPAAELVAAAVHRAIEEGSGATRAIDVLRRRLIGSALRAEGILSPRASLGVPIEPRVVRAIGAASRGSAARVGDVRRWEIALAEEGGDRPLPATTLWRRIVSLERAGYVRREIRPGGIGGTRSIVRLLAPIDEWVTDPTPSGTHRAGGPWTARSRPETGFRAEGLRPPFVGASSSSPTG